MGSEILRIAAEIRALQAAGRPVLDLTVGDFSPAHFPLAERLREAIHAAVDCGETNYPPASGVPALREAIRKLYARELGLEYGVDSVIVTGGARPGIYGAYRTLCDPGDRVVYPVPSWNNNHYCHMVGALGVPVACRAEDRFLPTRSALGAALPGARLLSLNSPLNPTGTALDAATLGAVCDAILEENRNRDREGARPLYLLYDQVYWMLRFSGTPHVTPPKLRPEMARYTLFVDGVSKGFAATGLRVGWAVGPADIVARLSAVLGHVGAWAPRAEQVATAAVLEDAAGVAAFHAGYLRKLQARLERLHRGLQEFRAGGLPVDSLAPQGAIYLAARIHPFGRRSPAGELRTNEDVRRYLLDAAGLAVVPFQAFGVTADDGWCRLSVGAVGEREIDEALPRLAAALRALS
ncbi:MAG TPA: aminotransferase class I/II-fold pyridoxal phosphate-dependent enzyme [Vicinamibacteria bacterium]|nr:aminotransferase class I/II-fold pyridoxal phosphate-dependent enzyme [Vicinamibacteria bacterium]